MSFEADHATMGGRDGLLHIVHEIGRPLRHKTTLTIPPGVVTITKGELVAVVKLSKSLVFVSPDLPIKPTGDKL